MNVVRLLVLFAVAFTGIVHAQNGDDDGRTESIRATCEEQDYYVGTEGENVQVCFLLDRMLTTSNVITRVTDNGTAQRGIDFVTQQQIVLDTARVRYCFPVNLSRDAAIERSEVVTISLSPVEFEEFVVVQACRILILDETGPGIECFDGGLLPGSPIDFRDIPNSFCLNDDEDSSNPLLDLFPIRDCTQWNYSSYQTVSQQDPNLLRNLVSRSFSTTCSENIKFALEELFGEVEDSGICTTNCALAVRGTSAGSSILLLEDVDAIQALDLMESSGSGVSCPMQLHCCVDSIPEECFETPMQNVVTVLVTPEQKGASVAIIAGASVGAVLVVVVAVAIVVIVIAVLVFLYLSKQKRQNRYEYNPESGNSRAVVYKARRASNEVGSELVETNGGVHVHVAEPLTNPNYDFPPDYQEVVGEGTSYIKWRMLFSGMIIKSNNLTYGEQIGEGAFGKVLKGTLNLTTSTKRRMSGAIKRTVAIKTLKKASGAEEIEDFIAESAIMLDFKHPNILRLVGVCFDAEDKLPVIILPLMANKDLRSFLKSKRPPVSSSSEETFPEGLSEPVLLGMCLEITQGMEYLSTCKFVHRDLAARNCMVDENLGVKVADFGLSRDVYHSNYYRLTHRQRLPVKWMAPESLFDNVYTEKTDVWSFGVVCWEIFKFGRKPFSGIDNAAIPDHISEGHRLQKPALCPDQLYEIMAQTWSEDPDERPDFNAVLKALSQLLGYDEKDSEQPKYSVLEGPVVSSEGGEEEDVGGENIYSELESPVYKNWENDRSSSVLANAVQLMPEEYEVPVPSRQSSVQIPEGLQVVPCEYEVPLSSNNTTPEHTSNLVSNT